MKYILALISISVFAAQFNPKLLENRAEIQGYGYKTSNLLELNSLFKAESQIKVPEFIGIPSPVIQKLLAQAGLDLGSSWSQIVNAQGIASQTLGQALQTKVLPNSFLAPSLELAEQIKSRFAKLSSAHLPKLQAFLAQAKTQKWRLMVRSTGKEDTDKLANAGGNLSVGNVSPEMPAVLNAIGRVIASYFEEKSLSQRLSAGDKTLFDLPLTPVLIQRMIGEELNGAQSPDKIPVGCVLYTQESAAKIAQIYTLQCAYGHNEGVVESLVPLDTYYIQGSGKTESVIKRKTKRIVPMVENNIFGLEEQNNPQAIQLKPALNQAAINLIATAGKQIDSYYQKRMDIELVYEPWTQITYIVQARPLVIPESSQEPSYLTQVTSFQKDDVLRITSINPGDSAIQRISHPEQILTARTLDDALRRYTGSGIDRISLQAVIVGDQADPTSHAAAVFRGDSKTIFVTEDLPKLETWLQAKPLNLMIDSQRGLILNTQTQPWVHEDLRALFDKRILKAGWLSYPLPLRVSVGAHQPEYCLAPQMKPDTFFGEVTCLTDRLEDQVRELRLLTERTRARAYCDENELGCMEQKTLAGQILPKLENLNTHAHELMQQIKANPNHDSSELLALFPKRFLESLVWQPAKSNLADAYSLESVQADYAAGQRFIEDSLKPLINTQILSDQIFRDPELFRIAQLGEKASLTDKTTQRFLRFVDQTSDRAGLIKLVDAFDNLGILPMWLNSQFMAAAEKADKTEIKRPYEWPLLKPGYGFLDSNNARLLANFEADYENSRIYLKTLQEKNTELQSYDLSVWSYPKNFSRARLDFKKKFENYFTSKEFLGASNDLQKMALTSIVERYVELFDQSIKTLKSSQDQTSKVEHFKIRIDDYLNLLNRWANFVPKEKIRFHSSWSLYQYLEQIKNLLQQKTSISETELLPSAGFSVAAAALGSAANFERHYPQNLEDFFTLIHQSLNTIIGVWTLEGLGNLVLPERFSKVYNSILNLQGFRFQENMIFGNRMQTQDIRISVVLIGVRLNEHGLVYVISLPLRNHSEVLLLSYNKADARVNLRFQFLGQARERWEAIESYLSIAAGMLDVVTSNIILNEQELQMTIDGIQSLSSTGVEEIVKSSFLLTFPSQPIKFDELIKIVPGAIERLEEQAKYFLGDPTSLRKALMVAKILLKHDRGLQTVQAVATKGVASLNELYRSESIDILGELVPKSLAFTISEEVVQKNMGSEEGREKWRTLNLLKALLEKGHALEIGKQEAERLVSDPREQLSFYVLLVRNGVSYTEAEKAAMSGMASSDVYTRSDALRVFIELVTKDQAFEQAKVAAKVGIEGGSAYGDFDADKSRAVSLYTALVDKGEVYDDAESALESVTRKLQNIEEHDWLKVLSLFEALFRNGHAYSLAQGKIVPKTFHCNEEPEAHTSRWYDWRHCDRIKKYSSELQKAVEETKPNSFMVTLEQKFRNIQQKYFNWF